MSSRRLLLLSNSTLHPTGYLEYAKDIICEFLAVTNVKSILFVPYALRDQSGYTSKVRETFKPWGIQVEGLNETDNPGHAVANAQAIFIGGGNTFQLLKGLYDSNIVEAIRKRVLEQGVPYIGSSAGTNVSTVSINTTNDMPIVFPPTFEALRLVPFNINPHYIDTDPNSTHKGETREERILQYQEIPGRPPVLALREGSILHVEGDKALLKGTFNARLFKGGEEPKEYPPAQDFSFLL